MENEVSYFHAYETVYTILSPDELVRVVQDFHVVIANSHVPVGYTESLQEELIENYRNLYQLLANGKKLEWKTHYDLFQIRNLTQHLYHCKYGNPHTYRGKQYLSPCFDEPCPMIAPFTIMIHKDKNQKTQFLITYGGKEHE